MMRLLEASLRFAGYISAIAVFGNKFSYEAKSSKHSMFIFEVGKAPAQVFHILIYDLAYINVSNMRVWSDSIFKQKLETAKSSLPNKEGLLCPNKVI